MWAPEAQIPASLMLRELRLAAVNIPRRWEGLDHIAPDTPDDQLPNPDQKVDRQWLVEFCDKQEGWREPSFWRDKEDKRDRGRPTMRLEILDEMARRASAGELAHTLAAEARQLLEWAEKTHSGHPGRPRNAKSIAAIIGDSYHELRGKSGN
jgi:hypothetical protein